MEAAEREESVDETRESPNIVALAKDAIERSKKYLEGTLEPYTPVTFKDSGKEKVCTSQISNFLQ